MRAAPAVWIRRSVLLANALALVVGLVLVVTAAFLSNQQVIATVLSLIGGAFVSAAVVTLVLGALAVRETVEQVDSALLRGLQDVLDPIRDPVFAGSLVAYRWDCFLACPLADDEHPDYAYQNMRISYRVDAVPAALQLVCAASRDDRALEEFKPALRAAACGGRPRSRGPVEQVPESITSSHAESLNMILGGMRDLWFSSPERHRSNSGRSFRHGQIRQLETATPSAIDRSNDTTRTPIP